MTRKRILEKIRSNIWVFPIFILSLVYILDARYFSSPPIHSDDWVWLRGTIFGELKLVDWTYRRPLGSVIGFLLTPLLGRNLQYYYLLNFLVIFLSGLLLYLIVRKAIPKYTWLALPVALIYLIYPVDATKTWISIYSIHFVLLLDFLTILLLMKYAGSGKIWQLLLVILLFIFTLGAYEAGLGIVVLAALLLTWVSRGISVRRRLSILSVVLIGGIYIIWRIFLQPAILDLHDPYISQMTFSIPDILYRYGQGLFIFIFNWNVPNLISQGQAKYITVLMGFILIVVLLAFLLRLIMSGNSINSFSLVAKKNQINSLLVIFLVGLLFWVAGYIPIISLDYLSSAGDPSRNNLFAIAGASLSLVVGISCVLSLVTGSIKQVRALTLITIVPFLLLGLVYQLWSQNERFKAWDEKKLFWNLMFGTAPGLKDNSKIVIIIPGYKQIRVDQVLPFGIDSWEAWNSIDVLYNNPTLDAHYYYLDRPHKKDNYLGDEVNWSRYLFVYYDPVKPSVEIVEHPAEKLNLFYQFTGYDPRARIINNSSQSKTYRWLVK